MATRLEQVQPTKVSLLEPSTLQLTAVPNDHPARRNDAKVFLRGLTRELIREISPTAKVLTLLAVMALTGGVIYFGYASFRSYRSGQQQAQALNDTQNKRISEHDNQLANLNQRLNQTNQQLAPTTSPASNITATNESAAAKMAMPSALWTSYGNGVCLIAGSYVLTEPKTGRSLRYPEVGQSPEERLLTTGTEIPLTFEGNGTIFETEFEGTGFHVGSGFLVTNRHIASEPWLADVRGRYFISRTGSKPRLQKLLAFCPGQLKPIAMTVKATSLKDDVAVCKLEGNTPAIGFPTLPLDQEPRDVVIGKAVVMMGYPTGPNRLLALLPEQEAVGVVDKYGRSLTVLLDQLAKQKLIRPLTTQGHITDLYKNRIVFDAATTQGSSGTPMFGESGKVIGMTFAIFVDDGASNFAVGINSSIELLRSVGWKAIDRN